MVNDQWLKSKVNFQLLMVNGCDEIGWAMVYQEEFEMEPGVEKGLAPFLFGTNEY